MIGKQISKYKILEKLGGGGMGVVYLAEDIVLKRRVALKFLPQEYSMDSDTKKRFILEAQAASAIQHQNICTIHEINETSDGQIYICMDYYEGETLKKKIESGALEIDDALDIAIKIAQGLSSAHAKQEIHRDIKPANIIITNNNEVKIIDFGLARLAGQTRLTTESTAIGTIAYMSPEQARGEKVDHRTDIWSLGVLLFEMISGQLPFKSDYDQAIIYSIINERHDSLSDIRPSVTSDLERIVNKTLAKDPNQRYQSMDELLEDLRSVRDHQKTGKKNFSKRIDINKKYKNVFITIGLIVLVIVFILIIRNAFFNHESPINSIAILPFENAAENPDLEYLCDGIPDNIISSLSYLPDLKVISSFSVRKYKGKELNPETIAEELNVQSVLLGRLLQPENLLSIRVELIDTRDNRQLWGNQYDQEFTKILDIQRDIANKISKNLRLKLSTADRNKLEKIYTENSKAYQAYLKGLYQWQKFTVEGFLKSIEYFEQALQKDPNFVLAYVGLALAYTNLGSYHGEMIPKEAINKAKEAVHKALKIDNEIGIAHTASGIIELFYDWNWARAEEEFLRGVELNPNSALTRQHFGVFLAIMGRTEESINQIKRAIELNPLALKIYDDLALSYLDLGQYERAIEQWKQVLDLDPEFFPARKGLGLAYLLMGWNKKALHEFRSAVTHSNHHHRYLGYLGWALGKCGYKDEARDILKDIQQKYQSVEIVAVDIAKIYIGLGEKNKALDWLEKAYHEGSSGMILIYVDPYYRDLYSEPRFKDLLKRMNFMNKPQARLKTTDLQ